MNKMISAPANNRPYTVGFLLLPKFSMIALSCAMESLREANWVAGKRLYNWVLLTPYGPQVHSSNDTCLTVEVGFEAATPCDMLIVCASFDLETHCTKPLLAKLRKWARHGKILGSIDTGSYILARAGVLDNRRATIHWENANSFAEKFPKVILTNDIFTIDGPLWTCSGGTSGIDMMLHLITRQQGHEIATGVTECMISGGVREGHTGQRLSLPSRLNTSDPALIAAIQIMEANSSNRLSIPEIANRAGYSQRQLERVFHNCLGMTPSVYYLKLRLQRARSLLRQTSLRIETIAASCGFSAHAHFTRSYKKAFSIAPSNDRLPPAPHFQ